MFFLKSKEQIDAEIKAKKEYEEEKFYKKVSERLGLTRVDKRAWMDNDFGGNDVYTHYVRLNDGYYLANDPFSATYTPLESMFERLENLEQEVEDLKLEKESSMFRGALLSKFYTKLEKMAYSTKDRAKILKNENLFEDIWKNISLECTGSEASWYDIKLEAMDAGSGVELLSDKLEGLFNEFRDYLEHKSCRDNKCDATHKLPLKKCKDLRRKFEPYYASEQEIAKIDISGILDSLPDLNH